MKRTNVFFKMGLAAWLVFGLSFQTIRLSAQCNVTNTGSSAAPTCSTQSLSLGAGESRNITFTSGVTYTFSFTNNPQSNGVCVGGAQYTANPVNVTILSPTGTVVTGMYRSSGTWSGTSATLSYKIADATTASISSAPIAVCAGGTTAALNGNAASVGNGSWSCTAVPSGGNAAHITFNSVNAENSTVTVNSAAAAGNYTLKWQIDNGGCTSSATTTLTVYARPAISTNPGAPAAICAGGTSGAVSIAATGGTPSLTYQWQYSSDNTSWSNAANGTPSGATYTNASSASGFSVAGISGAGTYYYRGLALASGAGCTTAASSSTSVSVVADPTISAQPSNASAVCVGGNASFSYTASGGTPSLTHQWQYSANGTSGWVNVADGTPTGSTYSGQTTNSLNVSNVGSVAGTYYYRSLVSAAGSDCATVKTDAVSVTVAASPSISSQPVAPSAVCAGGTSAPLSISATGGAPSLSYQWQYSADNTSWSNTSNGTPAGATYTNANSASGFTIAGISGAGTFYYRGLATASAAGCTTAASNSAYFTVVADPSISAQPSNSGTVCVGGNASFSYSASGGTPSLTHQWQYSADGTSGWANVANGTPTGSSYSGQTSTSLNVSNVGSIAGTHYYRSVVSASGSDCATVKTDVVSVTVAASPSITSHPVAPSAVCSGGTSDALSIVATGGTPSLSYQWQYSADNTSWSDASNGTPSGATYTNTNSASGFTIAGISGAGTYYYRGLASASGAGCTTAASNSAEFTVVANPSISAQPINAGAMCVGGNTSFSYTASGGTPSLDHQWQYSADGTSGWANVTNGSPSGSTYSGQNSASLSITNIGSVAGTHYYRSLISASGGNCSNAMTDVVNVSVTEVPTVTSHPSTPDAICAGGTSTAISVTGTGGTPSLSYVWQYSADSLNWNNATNNTPTGATYTNSTSASGFSVAGIQAAGNHFYRALLSASGSGCTSAPSNVVKLQVFATPSISATSLSNDSMCAGGTESASVTASGGSYGLQYQWQYQLNGTWINVANQSPAGISYTNSNTASMGIQTSVSAALGSFSYRCVVMISASGGSCDTAVSSTLQLSVLPSVWLGITSNATDPSNWLKGCVPVPGSRVEVNNTAVYDLPLTSNLTVSKLNFNGSGKKVILGVYDLTADSVTGADATNYIQTNGSGKLCMNLTTGGNKSFPVGLTAFNPVEITNNTAAADNFCVRILDEVYSEGTSGSVLSNDPRIKRTWDISKGDGSSNSGAGVDFKFWWNTNEDALNPSTFYLSHYDGTSWVQQPGTAIVSGRSLTYTGYMGGFSPFALNGNQPLPVSWLYVKGDCSNGRPSLSWATATEVNNRAFTIEGSTDGNVWNKITEVAGSKASSTVKTYQVDINMDYNYVRIRQEDYDGAFDYSEVVYMNCSAVEAEVAIVPNPSEGIFRILGSENLGTYVLFNALGQKVLEGNCSKLADRNLDLTGMEKGIYSLRISGSGKDILRKLVLK